MCYEPLVYRGREQDGRERESGDKGTPLKAVMDEKGLERNCPLPSLHSLYETKMAASVGLKRGNILSPVKSNLRIIDGFSFALLFNQSNQSNSSFCSHSDNETQFRYESSHSEE